MTFEATTSEPVFSVILFTSVEDKVSGEKTDWGIGVFSMAPLGKDLYAITLHTTDIPDYNKFKESWLLYQFVAINEASEVLGRSYTFNDISISQCSAPAVDPKPATPTPTSSVTPTPRGQKP